MAVKKLMVIGDSLSRGVVFDEQKRRYAYTKYGYVETVAAAKKIEVENYSRFGATVRWGWEALKTKLSFSSADAVLIEFGGNDCDYNWEEIAVAPEQHHDPSTPLKDFCETLSRMAGKITEAGRSLFFLNLPPLNAEAYFKAFTGGNKEKGESILRWLGCVDHIYWWHELYSNAVQTVAHACGANLINVRSEFLLQGDFRKYLCSDGIHPNDAGHVLISHAVARTLA